MGLFVSLQAFPICLNFIRTFNLESIWQPLFYGPTERMPHKDFCLFIRIGDEPI
jgi:hypothetical protein